MAFTFIVGTTSIFLLIQSFGLIIAAERHKEQQQQKQHQQNRIMLSQNRVPHWKVENNINRGPFYGQPEQVHLSYASDPAKLWVTWLTFDDTLDSLVVWGDQYSQLTRKTPATVDYFVDGGTEKTKRYTHRALIEGLKPGQRYFYRVGSQFGWSSIFSFVGLKERPNGGYKYAVFGDMGNINARSLGKLQREAQEGDFDMILHVGDLAYNLDTEQGQFGDEFMRQIEPISAYVPYMTVVGNHEYNYNFSHYINRFTMPNSENQNLFYSFDLGPAHFIAFSTEFYFWPNYYRFESLAAQWHWLIRDLEKANLNRHQVPWIITMGHRPMYCSDFSGDDCTRYDSIVRTGLPLVHAFGLEKLFFKYGVDLEIWAHEHTFERMYPVYNRTVYNGSVENPYVDPPAPVHIISGSAGCQENTDTFIAHPGPWSAFRSSNYGFSRMHIFNSTHLYFEQTIAANETIEDHFWLVKNRHGPYDWTDRKRLFRHGTYVPHNYCHHPSQCDKKVAHSHL